MTRFWSCVPSEALPNGNDDVGSVQDVRIWKMKIRGEKMWLQGDEMSAGCHFMSLMLGF